MPTQTSQAITWALQQTIDMPVIGHIQVTKTNPTTLVTKVREYFNTNNIAYSTFSYADLQPYL